jgi:formylglycine-generating enzyme required for sulfatase activity
MLFVASLMPLTSCATTMQAASRLEPQPAHADGSRFRDCTRCPEMVVVPAGSFLMGSPQDEPGRADDSRNHDEDDAEGVGGAQVRVTVPRFAIGVYEVTHREFREFIEDTGYEVGSGCFVDLDGDFQWTQEAQGRWDNPGRPLRDEYPVTCVDWHAAVAYTHWLSLRTGAVYRLPSEAEFEYARRAGSSSRYHFGDDQEALCRYGNVPDAMLNERLPNRKTTICRDGHATVAPVGQFEPNAFGLHDVTGNVWEWLQDCYRRSYAETPRDGSAFLAAGCSARSIRGGSWGYDLPSLRSADRSDDPPDLLWDGIGFRVARDLTVRAFRSPDESSREPE